MTSRWKDRMTRMGRANEEARRRSLRALTLEQAVAILEGLLAHPIARPRRRRDHPVSLAHRMSAPAARRSSKRGGRRHV